MTGEQPGWKGTIIDCPQCRQSCVPTVDGAGWVLPWHPDPSTGEPCSGSRRIVVGIVAT